MAISAVNLGRLAKVDLRSAFLSEAQDFTPWLAHCDNLKLLADTLDLELECVGQEQEVGPFRADILCRNLGDESLVLIENQLERTDHSHLGQLMTYAAGLEAVTIIWIAQRFTEEHRAALDWLNQITGEKFNFFGLEIELWQIGDSPKAPKFNIVCKPNAWTKTVQANVQSGELTGARKQQLAFWQGFWEYMGTRSSVKCQKPMPQGWMEFSIGRSGAHLASVVSTWDSEGNCWQNEIRAELVLDGSRSDAWYETLLNQKLEIENQLGTELTWYRPENAKKRRIYVRKQIDFIDEHQWPTCFEWLRRNLEGFIGVFSARVKSLP